MATSPLKSLIAKLRAPEPDGDETFMKLRTELVTVLDLYDKDRSDDQAFQKISELIESFRRFEGTASKVQASPRAMLNVAVASSRIQRTHFAAYAAGKYASRKDVPGRFKAWMHNAAANG